MRTRSLFISAAAVVVAFAAVASFPASCLAEDNLQSARIIQMGWGTPMDEYVRDHAGEMETWHPYIDGFIIGMNLRGQIEAKAGREGWDQRFCWVVFGDKKVAWENVAEAVANLKAGHDALSRPQDMYLRFNVIPGNVDWFDDAGWEAILHNAAIAGRIIREANLAGMFFDVEQYGEAKYGQGKPFQYGEMRHSDSKTFDEYAAQCRLRGRQFVDAFESESPERANIVFTWAHGWYGLHEYLKRKSGELKPQEKLDVAKTGNLLAAWVDGFLEGADEKKTTLYDGYEQSYGYRTEDDFRKAFKFIKDGYRFSQVPVLHKRKMKAALAIELDRNGRSRGGFFPDEPEKNYWTPKSLADALHWAMTYSDGLVWIYSEKPRFWPQKNWSAAYAEAFVEARKEKPFGQPPARDGGVLAQMQANGGRSNPTAAEVRGSDPEVLFRPLWDRYRPLVDLPTEAKFHVDPEEAGETLGWQTRDFDDSTWNTIRVDEFWQHQGYPRYSRYGWYRLRVAPIPDPPQDKRVLLAFGASDEVTDVFVNGQKRRTWYDWNKPFEVDVTNEATGGQPFVIAVKVLGGAGMGGLWAPIKLVVEK